MDDIALKAIYRELVGFNESVGCAYAVVKGAPLSLMCYNKPQIRGFGDIDILVSESSFALCKKWCDDNGFVESSSGSSAMSKMIFNGLSHQKQTYLKKHLGFICELDFNTDIFWGEYDGKRIDIDDFLSDAFETEIYAVYYSDDISDYGLIGAMVTDGETLELFSLSCRVIGKEIEKKMAEYLKDNRQIKKIECSNTGKNKDFCDWLKSELL